jgi:hypothetical protein
MVLLSQTPPKTSEGSAVLDEVLAFDFKCKRRLKSAAGSWV